MTSLQTPPAIDVHAETHDGHSRSENGQSRPDSQLVFSRHATAPDLTRSREDVQVVVVDTDNRFLYANRAWERATGHSLPQVKGRSIFEVLPDTAAREMAEVNRQALDTLEPIESEHRIIQSGAARTFLTVRTPLLGGEGRGAVVCTLSLDLTERRSGEGRAQILSEVASALLMRGDAVEVLLKELYPVVTASLGLDVYLHYQPESGLLKLECCGGIPTEQERRLEWLRFGEAICGKVAATRQEVVVTEAYNDARTHLIRELGIRAYASFPLLVHDRLLGTLSFGSRQRSEFSSPDVELLRSIAEMVAVALEREGAADALRQADQRKDQLLAVVAHELRAPIAAISTAAAVLSRCRQAPPEAAETAARLVIERQIRTLSRRVEDLLDMARIRQDKFVLDLQPVEIDPIIHDAIELARSAIDERGHALSISLPADPVRILADRCRLSQALCNLLINSAKFTPLRGHIALSALVADKHLHIEVSDDGSGICKEDLRRVFELFEQGNDDAHADFRGGLGIGLALVRSLVELHGGSVEARSPGRGSGSVFTVILPLLKQNPP